MLYSPQANKSYGTRTHPQRLEILVLVCRKSGRFGQYMWKLNSPFGQKKVSPTCTRLNVHNPRAGTGILLRQIEGIPISSNLCAYENPWDRTQRLQPFSPTNLRRLYQYS